MKPITHFLSPIFSLSYGKGGKPIGDKANAIWLYIVPRGMRSLMNYIKDRYGNPPIVITENGMDDGNYPFLPIKDTLKDEKRIKYHHDYLQSLLEAITDACLFFHLLSVVMMMLNV
ncbi:hypothetical protein Droror1_Dr00023871 [Drosera rotundifolia]